MTEWSKLKVPDLKAELKKRGLAQTGLKAELVARLTAAENETGDESEATIKDDNVEPALESTEADVQPIPAPAESKDDVKTTSEPQPPASQNDAGLSTSTLQESVAMTAVDSEPVQTQSIPPPNTQVDLSPSQSSDAPISNLNSVDLHEVIEDKQKRKRRSQSPPPSSIDVRRKRARQDDEPQATAEAKLEPAKDEVVTSSADVDWIEKNSGVDPVEINPDAMEVLSTVPEAGSDPTIVDVAKEEVEVKPATADVQMGDSDLQRAVLPVLEERQENISSGIPLDEMSAAKTKNSRFKDLFTAHPERSTEDHISGKPGTQFHSLDAMDAEHIERSVAPSIHPATSALYIRDFMRPLNAATLKEHLTLLATAPGATPDLETVIDFYLDPIRTHAFVSFKTTSAASRVRSELHDRIWPNERNRKPLWADFIPSEKIKAWISQEQSASSGPRSAGKKWEVVYNEDDDRNVTATLQEAGAFVPPARKPSLVSAPSAGPSQSRIEGVPSGPRSQQITPRPPPNRSHLDTLFKSTTAKPVLYYQPVDKALANRRLDHIDDLMSKRYSSRDPPDEINRYTFEDGDGLVDRGPEIFSGIRPPPGYRGRGGGGRGGGRGGSFRDRGDPRDRDAYRDRGDTRDRNGYRDRGDRYDRSGRDVRDSRDRRY